MTKKNLKTIVTLVRTEWMHRRERGHTTGHHGWLKLEHFDHFRFIVHNGEHSLMFPTATKERAAFVQLENLWVIMIQLLTDEQRWAFCVWMLVNFSTHVRIVLLVSQVSFVFDSTPSEFMLPLSKSGCTPMSWPGIKFESGLESEVNGAWSSTSEGSGLFSGETTDSDGGRRGWDSGRGPGLGLLLRVRLRFWSKPKRLSLGEEPVRLFRESTSWEVTWPTFWFKFLSKKWFVISGRTVKMTERYGFIKSRNHKALHYEK